MGTLRDAILNAQDLPTEEVATDEWGAFGFPTVRVRGLTAGERERWERSVSVDDDSKRPTMIREKLVALTVVDAAGNPEFTEADVQMLSNQSSAVIVRLFDAARRLSGMQTEDELAAANPSMGDQGENNSSDSPSPSE